MASASTSGWCDDVTKSPNACLPHLFSGGPGALVRVHLIWVLLCAPMVEGKNFTHLCLASLTAFSFQLQLQGAGFYFGHFALWIELFIISIILNFHWIWLKAQHIAFIYKWDYVLSDLSCHLLILWCSTLGPVHDIYRGQLHCGWYCRVTFLIFC